MRRRQNILIVGFGDIGKRVALLLPRRHRLWALVRKTPGFQSRRTLGVMPLRGDLARRASLRQLAGRFDAVLHFAPPPSTGVWDTHTRHLLAALRQPKPRPGMLTRRMLSRFVYVSTTGVYGNRDGAWVDEATRPRPETARALRRVDAEREILRWGKQCGVNPAILRAPGIYAADRLPLDRLRRGLPALLAADDVYTNHIHAHDLARACIAALEYNGKATIFNVVDDSAMRMGEYFDMVASAGALPCPPRISRAEAQRQLPPQMMSFMSESRRIRNRKLRVLLRMRLQYPTVASFLAGDWRR